MYEQIQKVIQNSKKPKFWLIERVVEKVFEMSKLRLA